MGIQAQDTEQTDRLGWVGLGVEGAESEDLRGHNEQRTRLGTKEKFCFCEKSRRGILLSHNAAR